MLTDKQEKFAQAVALEGMTYSDAYRSAYNTDKMTDKSVWDASSKLAGHTEVSQRISVLREQLTNKKIMTAQERMEWLTEVVRKEDETTGDKMKAIDIMNKMQGEYVQKVEAEVKNAVNISIELVDD